MTANTADHVFSGPHEDAVTRAAIQRRWRNLLEMTGAGRLRRQVLFQDAREPAGCGHVTSRDQRHAEVTWCNENMIVWRRRNVLRGTRPGWREQHACVRRDAVRFNLIRKARLANSLTNHDALQSLQLQSFHYPNALLLLGK